jgi:aryl-alcohol dehydrogenase-like predicted oxidoreductase
VQKNYTRRLGKSNIQVSGLGMGCFAIGGPFKGNGGQIFAYGEVDDKESIHTIHKALELGVNFFDTAEAYGIEGRSEKVLGEALKGRREDVVIATKFSDVFDDTKESILDRKLIREKLAKALNGSLERLQTDYIDVYQLHNAVQQSESALVNKK